MAVTNRKVMSEPQTNVGVVRIWKGVRLVAVPEAGMAGPAGVGWAVNTPGVVMKNVFEEASIQLPLRLERTIKRLLHSLGSIAPLPLPLSTSPVVCDKGGLVRVKTISLLLNGWKAL